jgi:hypothetical protein
LSHLESKHIAPEPLGQFLVSNSKESRDGRDNPRLGRARIHRGSEVDKFRPAVEVLAGEDELRVGEFCGRVGSTESHQPFLSLLPQLLD